MSQVVKYICEPHNFEIKIMDALNGVVTIALIVSKNNAIYQRYQASKIDYDIGNKIVKKFCEDIQSGNVRLFEDETLLAEAARANLMKVYNKLGLVVWKRKR